MLDKFSNVHKITDDVRLFYKELNEAKISLTDTDKLLGFANGLKINNEEFLSFLNNAEYSEKSLANYQKYMQSASTATSAFGATLKTVAANMAIMIAVTAAIKGVAWVIDQIAHRQENLNEKAAKSAQVYEELQDEVDSLNEKLETTNSRIKELSEMPNLTFVEQEELQNLKNTQ